MPSISSPEVHLAGNSLAKSFRLFGAIGIPTAKNSEMLSVASLTKHSGRACSTATAVVGAVTLCQGQRRSARRHGFWQTYPKRIKKHRSPREAFGPLLCQDRMPRHGAAVVASASFSVKTTASEDIDVLLKENAVIMFSKSSCPFCTKAKALLDASGFKYFVYELDSLSAQKANITQDILQDMTGARTVPQIFVAGQCIGGYDHVVSLHDSGRLVELVSQGARDFQKGPATSFKIDLSEVEWRQRLTGPQYRMLRQQGTEPPGTHPFNSFMPTDGYFACGACGLPLYAASSKFNSSCGWPVFDKCYYSDEAHGCHVGVKQDWGGLEIVCNRCDSHLGHVFFDAFAANNPNGERH